MTGTAVPARAAGILSIATGIATVALLANHPGGDAHTFADVLKDEAANRTMDAIVHGGFVVVLALQTICYATLSARIGRGAIAGLVLFAFGTAFLSASMVLDGLVTPALAAKYLAAPEKIEFAKSLFALVGTLIGLLMPIGLAFQSAAAGAWGVALMTSGISRIAGIIGFALGAAAFIALAATAGTMNPLVLMGVLAVTALWAVVAGIVLLRDDAQAS
jgi:MFS family permease